MFDTGIAFKMTTDTDRISAVGIELDGVDHRRAARGADVLFRVTVTTLAGNTSVQKGQSLETIFCSTLCALNAAHVAAHTTRRHRQSRGHPG
jgi:hypothetical protein